MTLFLSIESFFSFVKYNNLQAGKHRLFLNILFVCETSVSHFETVYLVILSFSATSFCDIFFFSRCYFKFSANDIIISYFLFILLSNQVIHGFKQFIITVTIISFSLPNKSDDEPNLICEITSIHSS